MFEVQRTPNGLIVNGSVDSVLKCLEMGNWGWTTHSGVASDGSRAIEVKGHVLKDNAVAAIVSVRPHMSNQTQITVESWKGKAMSALGGNVFNIGVKKFQSKVTEKAVQILTSGMY